MYETEDGKTTSKSSRLIKVTNLVMNIMSTRSICFTGWRRELEQREHPLPSDGHDQEGHSRAQVILNKFLLDDKDQDGIPAIFCAFYEGSNCENYRKNSTNNSRSNSTAATTPRKYYNR